MSNRVLSFLVLVCIGIGLLGAYYYFSVLSTGNITFIINGSGNTRVTLTSKFGNTYVKDCERNCLFDAIPAVEYSLSASRDLYIPFKKDFSLERRENKKMVIAMNREVILKEQINKKEDTIASIKLKKDIQDTLDIHTGSLVLGYRNNSLYYAIPENAQWSIFQKKEGKDMRKIFSIRNGNLNKNSLDIYEDHIALQNQGNTFFYALQDGKETVFKFDKNILSIKNTLSENIKIITGEKGVYMYTMDDNTFRENPLYDDTIQLANGEIVALVKKTSQAKQSLLSIEDTSHDQVFLIGNDTRERKTLFSTTKDGKILRYKDGKILFVDREGEVFVVENVR